MLVRQAMETQPPGFVVAIKVGHVMGKRGRHVKASHRALARIHEHVVGSVAPQPIVVPPCSGTVLRNQVPSPPDYGATVFH